MAKGFKGRVMGKDGEYYSGPVFYAFWDSLVPADFGAATGSGIVNAGAFGRVSIDFEPHTTKNVGEEVFIIIVADMAGLASRGAKRDLNFAGKIAIEDI